MLISDERLASAAVHARAPHAAESHTQNRFAAADATDLGINPLSLTLAGVQLAAAVFLAAIYLGSHLAIAWSTALPKLMGLGVIAGAWLYLFLIPGRNRREWVIAESFAVLFLVMTLSLIAGIGQYLVLLWQRPLIDPYLASADRLIGVSVPALVDWTADHDWLATILRLAYFTLLPQFIVSIVGLGIVLRDRARLWEFAFHFHLCGLVTMLVSGLFPAECAFTFYGFESLIDQQRFINHFEGLRATTFQTIRLDDIEGLISFPSFHVAGALMVTWGFRGYSAWLWPLIVLNIGLIAATFMTGAHYFVDVLATLAMFWASVYAYRGLTRKIAPFKTKSSAGSAGAC
jgi:hypothetical protein